MGIKLDLLPPSRYEGGLLNYINQNFIRIQQAFGKAMNGGAGTAEPQDPSTGDIWIDTTTKTVKVYISTEWLVVGSYESRTWTPIISQPGATGRNVLQADYQFDGDFVVGEVTLQIIGTGTANNPIVVTAPVAALHFHGQTVGVGHVYDAGTNTRYPGHVVMPSTTTLALLDSAVSGLGLLYLGNTGTSYNQAIANGDAVFMNFKYRRAGT